MEVVILWRLACDAVFLSTVKERWIIRFCGWLLCNYKQKTFNLYSHQMNKSIDSSVSPFPKKSGQNDYTDLQLTNEI